MSSTKEKFTVILWQIFRVFQISARKSVRTKWISGLIYRIITKSPTYLLTPRRTIWGRFRGSARSNRTVREEWARFTCDDWCRTYHRLNFCVDICLDSLFFRWHGEQKKLKPVPSEIRAKSWGCSSRAAAPALPEEVPYRKFLFPSMSSDVERCRAIERSSDFRLTAPKDRSLHYRRTCPTKVANRRSFQ